jgi:hypothetical protein
MIDKKAETVPEAVARMWPEYTFDVAIPQAFADSCRDKGFEPRGQFAYGYNDRTLFGIPLPLTPQAYEFILSEWPC